MKSTHSHHVAYAVILLMLGVIVGYGVGAAHENADQSEDQSVMSFFFGPKKKTTTAVLPAVTTTPSTRSTSTSTTTTATPDPFADWNKYADTALGFSFKYPSDWKIVDSQTSGYGSVRLYDTKVKYSIEGTEQEPILVKYEPDKSGADINKYFTGDLAPLKEILKSNTIKIDDKTAYIEQGNPSDPKYFGYRDERIVFDNNYLFSFISYGTILTKNDKGDAINNVFAQVLETVKFTK